MRRPGHGDDKIVGDIFASCIYYSNLAPGYKIVISWALDK